MTNVFWFIFYINAAKMITLESSYRRRNEQRWRVQKLTKFIATSLLMKAKNGTIMT